MPATSSQPNRSLINGLDVLEAVMAAEAPVGSRELGRLLGLDRSVANRLLLTLAGLGMLERTESGQYVPGIGVHALAALSLRSSGMLRSVLPLASAWTARGYAFTLGVLWRQHLCHLIHARPGQPVEQAVGGMAPGDPFHSAAGLVLLANAPAATVRAALLAWPGEDAPRRAQLAAVRSAGHGVNRFADGTVAVGVAIGKPVRAAIAVSCTGLQPGDETSLAGELSAQVAALPTA
jgi:DNA-binding IclR family transcriptional regulator